MELRLCVDGFLTRGMWCVGLTWELLHIATLELVNHGEECFWGYMTSAKEIFQTPLDYTDIGIAEALAMICVVFFARLFKPPLILTIVSDRLATLRTLENQQKKRLTNSSFHTILKWLRLQLSRTLQQHEYIKFIYFKELNFDSKWRPDQISRTIERSCPQTKPISIPKFEEIPGLVTADDARNAINSDDGWLSEAFFRGHRWHPKEHLVEVNLITRISAKKSERIQAVMSRP